MGKTYDERKTDITSWLEYFVKGFKKEINDKGYWQGQIHFVYCEYLVMKKDRILQAGSGVSPEP